MNPDPALQDITRTIQLAVAPVFLLSALGTTLSVLAARLGRVVDRARAIEAGAIPAGHRAEAAEELVLLSRRARLIHLALTAATTAALLVCLLIAVAFVGYLFGVNVGVPVAVMFILALGAFVLALLFFLREMVSAIRTLSFRLPPEEVDPALRTTSPGSD